MFKDAVKIMWGQIVICSYQTRPVYFRNTFRNGKCKFNYDKNFYFTVTRQRFPTDVMKKSKDQIFPI